MPCLPFQTPDGMRGIVCVQSRARPRCACGKPADLLCDYPVGRGKTCDRNICACHATEIGPDLHYCETHWRQSGMDHSLREGGA